jgi:hypothetical protein
MRQTNKQIVFTDHARQRMRQRRIDTRMVGQALKSPDRSFIEDDGDTRFIK